MDLERHYILFIDTGDSLAKAKEQEAPSQWRYRWITKRLRRRWGVEGGVRVSSAIVV